MPAHVTVRDIAARVGLSASAVSMALRNHAEISPATRQRVQAMAREMGYRPDPMLAALSAYRHGPRRALATLAWLTTGPTAVSWRTGYGEMLFAGAQREAHRLGYRLPSYWLDPAIQGDRHSQILEARGTAGLLVAPLDSHVAGIDLAWDRFAAVVVGHTLREPRLNCAQQDLYGGLLLVCRQLDRLGYRRIGLAVTAQADAYIDGLWSAAMLKFQSTQPAARRVPPLWRDADVKDVFLGWVRSRRPDVVIAYGQPYYGWLTGAGWRVPTDIGFVLLSDFPRRPGDPPFAALNHNFEAQGAAGVSLLHTLCITQSRGVQPVRVSVVVDAVWVPGGTVQDVSARSDSVDTGKAKPRRA